MLLLLQENIDVKKNATIIVAEYWNKKVGILAVQSLAAVKSYNNSCPN